MQPENPVAGKLPVSDDEGKTAQVEAGSETETIETGKGSLPELRQASDELKAKIDEAKRRNDMPVDSALGNPAWEQRAADGHLDVPDQDDE